LELIIVNDCSTDNTLKIVNGYAKKDSRVKIISNEINLKLPQSLNFGFAEATGEYLTWTSDDNQYHKDALERLSSILNCNDKVDLVYSDYTVIEKDGIKTLVQYLLNN